MPKVTFVVDCKGTQDCKEIRSHMNDDGFTVETIKNSRSGDHVGTKHFKTITHAEKEADKLMKKYDRQMWQITLRY